MPSESVSSPTSGLTFINYYDSTVSPAYRNAIVTAEHQLQANFTSTVTIGLEFDYKSLGATHAAENFFYGVTVSYAELTTALRNHATTSDDVLAVNGLPAVDPSGGAGFTLAIPQAVVLGLEPQDNVIHAVVTLNSDINWSFGQDAVGAIEHEITEGAFGRFGGLGLGADGWGTLDLFRFSATGQRDYSGGLDGTPTYFGVDSSHVTSLPFMNPISPTGVNNGEDSGDWTDTLGDAFGPASPSVPGTMSATDLRVLDVLGWSSATWTPAPDDFANTLADTTHPKGSLAVGGSVTGVLQSAGDRDWFAVSLTAGATYTIRDLGAHSGAGTLADPYIRLHDASGALLGQSDDIVDGTNPDSQISFSPAQSGVFYVEAGAFDDGYAGSYSLSVAQIGPAGSSTAGDDVLQARPSGGDSINGLAGGDTLTGSAGGDTLLGGDDNDMVTGGTGADQLNGNRGDDTVIGRSSVGDTIFGGQGNDLIDLSQSSGHNNANGNIGDDTVMGGPSGNTLYGGQGNDVIVGGGANDWISGDRGSNTLTGGAGADTFHAGLGSDVVTDFHLSEGDRVQISAGVAYQLSQSNSDVLISLPGGTQMLLQNNSLASLGDPSGWLITA